MTCHPHGVAKKSETLTRCKKEAKGVGERSRGKKKKKKKKLVTNLRAHTNNL
jgi:hypothetical protein